MNLLQAFFLGIIQGITEFLPISSSAHLVIFQKLFGLPFHDINFDLVVHLATLLSVVTIFHRVIFLISKEIVTFSWKRHKSIEVQSAVLVFIGSIPTAIIGFTFKDTFENLFSKIWVVGILMCITGVILFLTYFVKTEKKDMPIESKNDILRNVVRISFFNAILIGIAQGGAIAPGVSRSGITISTALFLGVAPDAAALFSFLLAIPVVLGASLIELVHLSLSLKEVAVLGMGFFSSYFSGLLGLWLVLKVVKRRRLEFFSVYMWVVGISLILFG